MEMCGAVTYQRISKASFLDVASQVGSQGHTSGRCCLWCPRGTEASSHPSEGMWLTASRLLSGPVHTALSIPLAPTHQIYHKLSKTQNNDVRSVRLRAGAEEACVGAGNLPCPPYLCLHWPRAAVLVTSCNHPGPTCQWAASGL